MASSITRQLAEVRQQLWHNQRGYSHKVQAGKMPQAEMDEKIQVLRDVIGSLEELQGLRERQQEMFGETHDRNT